MAKDNILLITTDQQRFDTLNAWGNQSIFTPHLNYMAAMGISYKNCYASCPICVPSRTTIITGRQGYESGVVSNATHETFMRACTEERSTLPAVLTDAGYQTCAKGKMHFEPARAHYGFEHMKLPLDYMREYDKKQVLAHPKAHGVGECEAEPVISTVDVKAIMMVSNYADIIVMRHYLEGAARYASEVAPVPIVNAGDGANQHPSQTMLDLYSIYKTQGTLENLNIFLVGDLKYGRTVHSLLMAMRHFNPTFHFIAPDELKMPEEYKLYCKTHQIKYVEHTDFSEEIIADADILYMTRVQRERFTDLMEYERVKNVYILRNKMLENTRPNLRILHPLPRVNEIAYDVDDNPKAYYFQQAQNGLYAREAILCDVLGITLEDVKNDILL